MSLKKKKKRHLMMKIQKPNIIIDIGTCYIKAGLRGDKGPRAVFPSIVGYLKYFSGMVGGDKKEFSVGEDAYCKRGVLNLKHPIECGVVNNWDDIEKIFGHVFTNELRVFPEEHNIMLTEKINNPKENREKMTQIMFETYNVPGLYIVKQAVLPLLSAGKFTGIVIDLGGGVTQFAPIFDFYCLPYGSILHEIGGNDLTQYMMKLLTESGNRFSTSAEKEIVCAIKEKSCYVALDFQEELRYVEPFDYELPDGTHIIIKDQRIRCPEALFKPSMIAKYETGIDEACYNSIQRCDIDLRRDLYNNIILSGGNSKFEGLPERLSREIRCLAPESMKEEVRVIASLERKFAVFIGGCILSSISSFESNWITMAEYEQYGAAILHRKCF